MPPCPDFSVIIPTYNRPQLLETCLKSITGLAYPVACFEVIVVDDGSDTDLEQTVALFREQLDIQLCRKENEGPASARNFGAARAQGRYLAFTDDDCQPAADWLSRMAAELRKTPARLLGGKTVNLLKQNPFSEASQFIVDIVYDHYNAHPGEARFFASNNMVVPKDVFTEIGGFADGWRTSEDRELCDRWLWHGYKMGFVREALVYHTHELTLFSFCRQHFSYGKGAGHYHRIRRQRQSGTMRQEMAFHADFDNWLVAPFARKKKKPVLLFLLLLLWQAANLAGFVWVTLFEKKIPTT